MLIKRNKQDFWLCEGNLNLTTKLMKTKFWKVMILKLMGVKNMIEKQSKKIRMLTFNESATLPESFSSDAETTLGGLMHPVQTRNVGNAFTVEISIRDIFAKNVRNSFVWSMCNHVVLIVSVKYINNEIIEIR
ncbi:unnamed protein product [Callosobruchus maculatus]|uniref:Uncharacterized protein n=1 Tax=Callosobruchus maculatus TaxID=64391 RepID=A0A653BQC0_CALMS|nr:unnamed protein product [Callosobruchus maculatus]